MLGGNLNASDLVFIGVFAAAAKISSVVIALAGGGIDLLALIAKNIIVAVLLVVLMTKVNKRGALFVCMLVSSIVGSLLSGSAMMLAPSAIVGALVGEMFFRRPWIAVCVSELTAKTSALAAAWVVLRESPALFNVVLPVVLIGALGTFLGLWLSRSTVRELRHAGFLPRFS